MEYTENAENPGNTKNAGNAENEEDIGNISSMETISISRFAKELEKYVNNAAIGKDRIRIETGNGNLILISENRYRGLMRLIESYSLYGS